MASKPEPLSARGALLLDADDDRHDEAVEVLLHAVAAGEPSAPALLARAYLDRGHRRAAIRLLEPRVRAGRADLALPLAEALTGAGELERAEAAYLVAVGTGDPEAMTALGMFLREQGRLSEAERMLRRAAEAGSDAAPAQLVAVQWRLGEPRLAEATARRWADPARPSTLHALAFVLAASGRDDEAERLYRTAAELGALRGHIEYARFLLNVRDDAEAAEAQLLAAERTQEPGWALAFGLFLADAGRPDEARAYLRHAAHWGSAAALDALEELDGDPTDD